MKNHNQIKSIIYLVSPIILGTLIGILIPTTNYITFDKPAFAPPSIVFPIVWTILYLLMGISGWIISKEWHIKREGALNLYWIQLFINLLWSVIFFVWDLKWLAFIWILLLIYFVVQMILSFLKINKTAAYLQIPYLLWLIFAAILNFSIAIMN